MSRMQDAGVLAGGGIGAFLFALWCVVAGAGFIGFLLGASISWQQRDGAVQIACTEGERSFAYWAPDGVLSVDVFDRGRHVVTVLDTVGRVRVIDSDNHEMHCGGDSDGSKKES